MTYEIIPGEGMGNLAFGMFADDIRELIGPPEQVEKDEDELFHSIIWLYPEKGLTLFFRWKTNPVLIALESSHPETMLFGEKIFGLDEEKLISLLKINGMNEIEIENETWGERRISNEDSLIDFYFGEKGLATVNWSVITDDDD